MPKLSAGLLLYGFGEDGALRVLVAHPGGPFWARKDDGAWSIPKGEYPEGEDPHAAALREFAEELGGPPPEGDDVPLGEIRQPSGKRLTVWAREGPFDAGAAVSNLFELEWPRGSGRIQAFPEVDRVAWLTVPEARRKLLVGHVAFLDRLLEHLGVDDPHGGVEPAAGADDPAPGPEAAGDG